MDSERPTEAAHRRFTYAVEGPTPEGKFQVVDLHDRAIHGTHSTKELAEKRKARLESMKRPKRMRRVR